MIKRYMLASACQFVIGGYWVHHETLNQRSEIPCFDGWDQHADGNFFFEALKRSENTNLHTLMGQLNRKLHFPLKKYKLQLLALDPAQKVIQW